MYFRQWIHVVLYWSTTSLLFIINKVLNKTAYYYVSIDILGIAEWYFFNFNVLLGVTCVTSWDPQIAPLYGNSELQRPELGNNVRRILLRAVRLIEARKS